MHANVYSFWGQVEPRTEPSPSQRGGGGSTERERGGEGNILQSGCASIHSAVVRFI